MLRLDVCCLALLLAACLDMGTAPVDPTSNAVRAPQGEHLWVFHIGSGQFASHVQLVAIGDQADAGGSRVFRPIPSRAWGGASTNDLARFTVTPGDSTGHSWILRDSEGQTLRFDYKVIGDTALGGLALPDGSEYPAFGVRFDSAAVNLIAKPLRFSNDSQPVVIIRLDDAFVTDRDFVRRLKSRGLTAEIAVPTRLVGQPGHLTWDELRQWHTEGFAVAAHSRYHLQTSADAQHLIAETVGGFSDMAAQGLASNIFVQPGTWRDSILFDSPAKVHTWRGALLRTFATVSECYVYPNLPGRADSLALGLSHATISDGQSDQWIRLAWQMALRRNHATVFLVHTFRLTDPGKLDWFLDVLADARAHGMVRVVASSEDLFFSRNQRQAYVTSRATERALRPLR